MWNIFSRPVAATASSQSAAPVASPDAERISAALLARITASETALPIVKPEAILRHHEDRIVRTRQLLGLSAGIFDAHVLPVFLALAEYCNTLPASNRSHYRYPLGAFGFAVDLAHNCAQSAAGAVFEPGVSAEDRPLLEPRWRLAATLAGLCREMHRIAHECKVTHGDETWGPYSESLYSWATRIGAREVYIRWLSSAAAGGSGRDKMAANAYLARSVIPTSTLDYMYAGSERIARSFLDYLAGAPETTNPIAALVDRCRAATLQRQLETESRNYGVPVIGIHLEPLIVEAIRARVQDGTWTVNQKGSVVFVTDNGVFMKWPIAARDISRYLTEQKVVSAPAEADALQRVAEQARIVIEARTAGGQWVVQPMVCSKPFTALRLATPAVAFADRALPAAIQCELIVNQDAPPGDEKRPATTREPDSDGESGTPTKGHDKPKRQQAARGSKNAAPSATGEPKADGELSGSDAPAADEADTAFPSKLPPKLHETFIKKRCADVKEFAERFVVEKVLGLLAVAPKQGPDATVVTVDGNVYLLELFFGLVNAVPKDMASKILIKHKILEPATERLEWTNITIHGAITRAIKVNAEVAEGLELISEAAKAEGAN